MKSLLGRGASTCTALPHFMQEWSSTLLAVVLRQTVYFNELRLNVTLDRYFIKITKQEFCRMKNKNFHFSCKLSFDTCGHP